MESAEFDAYKNTIKILNPEDPRYGAFTPYEVVCSIMDKYSKDENLYCYVAYFGKLAINEMHTINGKCENEAAITDILKLVRKFNVEKAMFNSCCPKPSDKLKTFRAIFNDKKLALLNRQGEQNYNLTHPAPKFSEQDILTGLQVKSIINHSMSKK